MEVPDIRTIFAKDTAEWLNWINQGKLVYADIEKLQSLIDQQRINFAEVEYFELEPILKLLHDNKEVNHFFPKSGYMDNYAVQSNNNLARPMSVEPSSYTPEPEVNLKKDGKAVETAAAKEDNIANETEGKENVDGRNVESRESGSGEFKEESDTADARRRVRGIEDEIRSRAGRTEKTEAEQIGGENDDHNTTVPEETGRETTEISSGVRRTGERIGQNHRKKPGSETEKRIAEHFGKITREGDGLTLRFYDYKDGDPTGYHKDGVIYISNGHWSGQSGTYYHELFHALSHKNPVVFEDTLIDFYNRLATDEEFQGARDRFVDGAREFSEEYAEEMTQDPRAIAEEILAYEFTNMMLERENFDSSVNNENFLAEKELGDLRYFLNQFYGQVTYEARMANQKDEPPSKPSDQQSNKAPSSSTEQMNSADDFSSPESKSEMKDLGADVFRGGRTIDELVDEFGAIKQGMDPRRSTRNKVYFFWKDWKACKNLSLLRTGSGIFI